MEAEKDDQLINVGSKDRLQQGVMSSWTSAECKTKTWSAYQRTLKQRAFLS